MDPPDVRACVSLSEQKGFCTYTISDKEEFLTGQPWLDLKMKSLVVPAGSWSEVKKFILKICKKTQECSVNQVQRKLDEFEPGVGFNDK